MYDTIHRNKNLHRHLYNKEMNPSFKGLSHIIETNHKSNHRHLKHKAHMKNAYQLVAPLNYVTQHVYLNNANLTYFYEPRQTAVVPQSNQMVYPYFYEEVRLETPSYNYVGCYASEGSSMTCNEFFF